MVKPDGSIIETPITASFREGLSILHYFISTHGGRKGLSDTALKTSNAGYLTRRLVNAVGDIVVVEQDCGTSEGMDVDDYILEGITTFKDIAFGRFLARDVTLPGQGTIKQGTLIDESVVKELEHWRSLSNVKVNVRWALSCKSKYGVCASCYGLDLGRGCKVNLGEAVGLVAAQSIGEPGTQLTMTTFHIGGAALQAALVSDIQVKSKGKIKFHNIRLIQHAQGHWVSVSRSGEILLLDAQDRESIRYSVPYGASILVNEGEEVLPDQMIAQWDPYVRPIVSEVAGSIRFIDLIDGVTVNRLVDELTGLTSIVVIDAKRKGPDNKELRPMVCITDSQGNDLNFPETSLPAHYFLPPYAVLSVEEGSQIGIGDVIARIPQEATKTRDITGGLVRATDLFEARQPKEAAVLAEMAGVVSFGKETRGKRRLVITGNEGQSFEVLIPKWRHVTVFEGEHVNQGEAIVDGSVNPHDELRLKGKAAAAKLIINGIQQIYGPQGVTINSKHIEMVARVMLQKVEVVNGGDSRFLEGELLEEETIRLENQTLLASGKVSASYKPILMGITKAALDTPSPIAAASFQEAKRVLSKAAFKGKTDELRGLRESVIFALPMPAGTGFDFHVKRRKQQETPNPAGAQDSVE
jgi:DNA-directed RNA polymerase subunit beta'